MQSREAACKSVAMRILCYAVRLSHDRPQNFNQFLIEVRDRSLEDIYGIHLAVQLIGGDPTKNCVVAVDEVNRIAEPDGRQPE